MKIPSLAHLAGYAAIALAILPLASLAWADDAALDPSFATHETPRAPNDVSGVRAIAVQADGKIVLGGDFSDNFFANHITGRQQNLTRLQPDGHYDPAFKFTSASDAVETIFVLPDGKLLLGGSFTFIGTDAIAGIVRLNADGSTDKSFGAAGTYALPGSRISVLAIARQPDGKFLIGGAYRTTLADGSTRDNLMRLNADGTADPTFKEAPDTGVGIVTALALQPDGQIIAGGGDGKILARYRADGTLDPTLVPHLINGRNFGRTSDAIRSLVLQPDGKILAGGNFVAGDTLVGRASLVRFNPDGSLDLTFDAGINDTVLVRGLRLQADGKIVAGGSFAEFQAAPRPGLVRVNADGSVDPAFDPGAGAVDDGQQPAKINAVVAQPDGKLLIGGNLVSYQGQPRAGIARLVGGATPPPPARDLADLSGSLTGVKAALNSSGSKFKVSGELTVQNSGPVKAKNVQVAAYFSDDAVFSATDDRLIDLVSLADEGFAKIKLGKPVKLKVKFKARASDVGSTSGKYLLVVIDPRNAIEESDETNNVVFFEVLP